MLSQLLARRPGTFPGAVTSHFFDNAASLHPPCTVGIHCTSQTSSPHLLITAVQVQAKCTERDLQPIPSVYLIEKLGRGICWGSFLINQLLTLTPWTAGKTTNPNTKANDTADLKTTSVFDPSWPCHPLLDKIFSFNVCTLQCVGVLNVIYGGRRPCPT